MADFKKAHDETGGNEGGWANVEGDGGLETYAGISRRYHPEWKGWPIVDAAKPLKRGQFIKSDKLKELVLSFYKTEFWDAIGGDKIHDQQVATRLYDFAVNAAQKTSLKQIQEVLGIPQTGKVDAATIAAINNPGKHLIK